MKNFAMTCAVNPYALTEAVLRRKINWHRISNPVELVSRTLETPVEDLFDGGRGSPIFALQKTLTAWYHRRDFGIDFGPTGQDFPIPGLGDIDLRLDISDGLKQRVIEIILALFTETDHPRTLWLDVGDFFEEGTEFADPVQGAVGDCWLIAALASVAWSRPYAIVQRNRATGPGQSDFVDAIDLQYSPTEVARYEVTEKLPILAGTTAPAYARSSEPGEIWPGVYEKAFAKLRTGNQTDKPNFGSLNGGDGIDACVRLVPGLKGSYFETKSMTADKLWTTLVSNCVGNPGNGQPLALQRGGRTVNPMVAWTYGKASEAPDRIDYGASGIVGSHCYSILGWFTPTFHTLQGRARYIVLRNPWGFHEGKVDVLNGSWNAYDQSWMRHIALNANGVFAMEIGTFKKYFAGMGVAS